jgi:tetratricopeptide (TPR) repeat protein
MAYQSELEKLKRRYEEKPSQWFAALAEEHRRAGDIELALQIVRGGLEKRSNYVSGHIVLARCLLDRGEDEEAQQQLERVLELDAENVIALRVLSEIAERLGDPIGARGWVDRLLEVDPMNEEAQLMVSRLADVVAATSEPSSKPPSGPDAAEPEAPQAESPPPPAEPEASQEESPPSPLSPLPSPAEPEPPQEEPEVLQEVLLEESAPSPAEPAEASQEESPPSPLSPLPSPAEPEPPQEEPEVLLEVLLDESAPSPAEPEAPQAEPAAAEEESPPSPLSPLPSPAEPEPPQEEPEVLLEVLLDESAPSPAEPEASQAEPEAPEEESPPSPLSPLPSPAEPAITGAEVEHDTPLELSPEAGVGPPPEDLIGVQVERPEPIELVGGPGMVVARNQAGELVGRADEETGEQAASGEEVVAPAMEEPEPVVTQTMAEVYVKQGLIGSALKVYRELLAQRPEDPQLLSRIAELESGAPAPGDAPVDSEKPRYLASETGGTSARSFLAALIAAGNSPPSDVPHPTSDVPPPTSDVPPPTSPGRGERGEGRGVGGGVSFDEFFGETAPKRETTEETEPSEAKGDDDDFKDWLKGLKS